ncbi:nitroreductase family protein [Streptomyces sp. NPDC088816]|uniref:nitroreductase family protein n=1 Tax=unclassified Streptomyces TaxID=2593676 RepID=UPI003815EC46
MPTPRTPGARAAVEDVLGYVETVSGRMGTSLEPVGRDRPSPHTVHPAAARIMLPPAGAAPMGDIRRALRDPAGHPGEDLSGIDGPWLSRALHLSAGTLSRRWQIDWTGHAAQRARAPSALWGRGTPSGGGTYPWELYWAPGPGLPIAPGVLHYASGPHALERLTTGDPTPAIRAALPDDPGRHEGGFLLCTVRLWKNAYKYAELSYHLATHDLGALLGTWSALHRARAVPYRHHLWFDEPALNRVLGLDPRQESVHAVIPLPWGGAGRAESAGTAPQSPPVRRPPGEASRPTRAFARADAARRATAAPAPVPSGPPADHRSPGSATGFVPLPPEPCVPARDLADVLSRRSSAFGRMDPSRSLSMEELAVILRSGADGPHSAGLPRLTGLSVLARRVRGLAPGAYHYDRARHGLVPAAGPGPGAADGLTQRHYAMQNYAVDQAAALVAFTWRPRPALETLGPRAYRAAHAESGAASQYVSLAAQSMGIACGIVLGMDARAVDDALGADDDDRRSSLCAFVGHLLPGTASLDDRLR